MGVKHCWTSLEQVSFPEKSNFNMWMAWSVISSVYSFLLLQKSYCQGKYLNERNLELELLFIMLSPQS